MSKSLTSSIITQSNKVEPINDLIIKVNTENTGSPGNEFELRGRGGGYDIVTTEQTFTNVTSDTITLSWNTPGIYEVHIIGQFNGFNYGNTGDRFKLIDIVNWGIEPLINMDVAFYGCSNLEITSNKIPQFAANCPFTNAFRGTNMSSASQNTLINWDMTNVHLTNGMFAQSNFNADIGNWNMSGVTNIAVMFYLNSAFNQDISSWDVSNVGNFFFTFNGASSFNQDIGNWEIWNATNFSEFLSSTNLSVENYSRTLIGFANGVYARGGTPSTLSIDAAGLQYDNTNWVSGQQFNNAVDAVNYLTTTLSWTLNDDGQI